VGVRVRYPYMMEKEPAGTIFEKWPEYGYIFCNLL